MVDKMANGDERLIAKDLMQNTNLPFTDRVMRHPLPDKLKVPRVDKYDGSGDPTNHIESFRAHLILHDTPDEIACRAFPLTLKGAAKEWIEELSVKSVDNFNTLRRLFLSQFLATRKGKNPTYLLSLKQGKSESLKDYMLRFNWEKLTVESPNEQTVLLVLMNGVKAEGPLMAEIAKKPTIALRQFLSKTEEDINQEETVEALMQTQKDVTRVVVGGSKSVLESSGKKKEERNPKKLAKKANLVLLRIRPLHQQDQ
ncbi:uncharacterized protein LOC132165071 [Corylus avellana]|uniref:uncharacterized protein LOC132165071 n=1 Tax=Corylus avellana TaxID=13451 RepID=UPI002869F7A7|nr:uncharacterized protein LOC132165071 [Corylus avellana]